MRKSSIFIKWIFALCMLLSFSIKAYAAEATVTFGSDSYSVEKGSEFNVGVYIDSEEKIGTYDIELEYDTTRLEYISGAENSAEGVITLKGTGIDDSIRYWLTFKALDGGEAGLAVTKAIVNRSVADGGETIDVSILTFAPINVTGSADDKPSFKQAMEEKAAMAAQEEALKIENRYPILGKVSVNGTTMYLPDYRQFVPEEVKWSPIVVDGTFLGSSATYLTDKESQLYVLYLLDEAGNTHPFAVKGYKELYELKDGKDSTGMQYVYVTALACNKYPYYIDADIVSNNNIAYVINKDGHGIYAQISENGDLHEWTDVQTEMVDEAKNQLSAEENNSHIKSQIIALIMIFLAVLATAIVVVMARKRLQNNRASSDKAIESSKAITDLEIIEVDDDTCALVVDEEKYAEVETAIEKSTKEEPVISIQHVTMKYKISTSDASGLKEFLIQKIKKKVSYRELLALNDVSFDVYKGEVVGIIGTNGSGKSTLLRIVSGALNPTSGRVIVDKSKVQILTLGTGFDMELTARENVYLNGAIIGYSKKFIDTHFDEIIAFAELEDFVDEKVKNFSSGMVSRLGFAIATAGNAAEILILDEVLSVGDEFFKKKSLARIKEMIHGGSTVLMVSHGMSTITENCSKAVWIEKGKLQMIGDVCDVCRAYQNLQAN